MLIPKLPHILYGGDYNPEQWPEEVWREDMRLMRDAGVNFVSIGIFSWAKLERTPGDFTFEWLDRLMDLLAENGIFADLATATASPPAWLIRLHPEILPVKADGTRLWHGSRQHYNPASAAYREACTRIVRALADRYKAHPALAAWHVNNEYACHLTSDYSDETAEVFRQWLREKYHTLHALNDNWGTAFWSQHYYDWEEIYPPRQAPTFPNPCQVLDFQRFSSDQWLGCFLNEARILREITPDIPISTNFMGTFKALDYSKWAPNLDFTSWDSYPEPLAPSVDVPFDHDLMRSLKVGRPFVLMEQVTTQVNWRERNPLKRPGVMRLWSYQAIAHGADGIMFFQWRQARGGAEKFHGAMVGPQDPPETRPFREVVELGNELKQLGEIAGSRIEAQAAILFDYENWWALELPSKPSAGVRYIEQIRTFYAPLFARNIALDIVFADSVLSSYKLLVAPALYLVKPGVATKLERFVEEGGTLVLSFFSGIVDESDRIFPGGYPAPFRKLLGIEVEEWDPLPLEGGNRIKAQLGGVDAEYQVKLWCDLIRAESAEVVATFESDFYTGRPAVTRNRFGKGTAWYVGTQAEGRFYADLFDVILGQLGISAPVSVPPGIEVTKRLKDGTAYLFVLNHLDHKAELTDPALRGRDLLTGRDCNGTLQLAAKGVAIIRS